MEQYKYRILAALAFIGILILWAIVFTAPFWLVWNYILSVKFGLPQFTFSETFFVILLIKWLFGSTELKNIKKELGK